MAPRSTGPAGAESVTGMEKSAGGIVTNGGIVTPGGNVTTGGIGGIGGIVGIVGKTGIVGIVSGGKTGMAEADREPTVRPAAVRARVAAEMLRMRRAVRFMMAPCGWHAPEWCVVDASGESPPRRSGHKVRCDVRHCSLGERLPPHMGAGHLREALGGVQPHNMRRPSPMPLPGADTPRRVRRPLAAARHRGPAPPPSPEYPRSATTPPRRSRLRPLPEHRSATSGSLRPDGRTR